MYGEGYDYAPQYTAMSGDMVGSLPVGIETKQDADEPYWPMQNCYNYKEVWVHPSARWLWLMEDLYASDASRMGRFERAEFETKSDSTRVSIEFTATLQSDEALRLKTHNLIVTTDASKRHSVHAWSAKSIKVDVPWIVVIEVVSNAGEVRYRADRVGTITG